MKNTDVIRHFLNGRKAVSHTSNLSTCGSRLYSYDLEIARHQDYSVLIFDFTAPAGFMQSQTTSSHVNATKREAWKLGQGTTVMRPDVAREAGLIAGGK